MAAESFENDVLPSIVAECFPPNCVHGDLAAVKKAINTEKLRSYKYISIARVIHY